MRADMDNRRANVVIRYSRLAGFWLGKGSVLLCLCIIFFHISRG